MVRYSAPATLQHRTNLHPRRPHLYAPRPQLPRPPPPLHAQSHTDESGAQGSLQQTSLQQAARKRVAAQGAGGRRALSQAAQKSGEVPGGRRPRRPRAPTRRSSAAGRAEQSLMSSIVATPSCELRPAAATPNGAPQAPGCELVARLAAVVGVTLALQTCVSFMWSLSKTTKHSRSG